MYCRCPECQTVFSITQDQLKGRNGLVRCGHCTSVFRGDQNLVDSPGSAVVKPRGPVAVKQPEHATAATDKTGAAPEQDSKKEELSEVQVNMEPVALTKTRPVKHIRPDQTRLTRDEARDILKQLVGRKPGEKTRPVYWNLGIVLLTATLILQGLYYYRNVLAWHPKIGPHVHNACEHLGCDIARRRDVAQIELSGATVAPHPKYKKVLQVKATLINRARFVQPFPVMEVKLTNRRGEISSRRLFSAEQYLKDKSRIVDGMSLNTAIAALLDVNNPDQKTEGYEIRLVAQ